MPGRSSFLLNLVVLCVSSLALGIIIGPALGGGAEWTGLHTRATVVFGLVDLTFGSLAYQAWNSRSHPPRSPSPTALNVFRVAMVLTTAALLCYLLVGAWTLPAASVPAMLGATVAVILVLRRRDRNAVHWALSFDQHRAYRTIFFAAAGSGALGYALLAALGIGVPDPTVSLAWRAFGGLAVGAVAGILAGLGVTACHAVALVTMLSLRRPIR